MDDLPAIRLLKRGDLAGLAVLVERYQVKGLRTAYLILHDEAAAEEVFQDVCLRLTRMIRSFDESRPFEPYLMASIVHAALNRAVREAKTTSLDQDEGRFEKLLSQAASVESQVEAAELQQEVLQALSQLSPRQRAVIVQRYYLQMSEKEMAQALSAAPGTVKWQLNAARARLRRLLGLERSEQ
jgi:RNA polymerase sigma-70 factor (ECF subfamily)